MKIVQIVQEPQRRGAEVFAQQLAGELRSRGHGVSTVYLYPHDGLAPLALAPEDRQLGGDPAHPWERGLGAHPVLLRRLLRHLDDVRPDVVQANGARTVKYGALARRLRSRDGWKLVYRNIGDPHRWVRGVARRLFYRLVVMPAVDGVVAVSRVTLDATLELYGERASVQISQAVDPESLVVATDRRSVRLQLGTPEEAPVAIFVGSLSREKRPDRLIEAVRRAKERHPELEFWLVGDGPLAREARRQAETAGLASAVRFLGARPSVADYLGAADLFVLASDTEGQPGALLEAAWMGLPAIATRVGGVPEILVHGETGLLVDADDGTAMADALCHLLARPAARAAMGEKARERARTRFGLADAADRYLEFYRELLEGHREERRG